jgi:hypothetical protein
MKVAPDKHWEVYDYRADHGPISVRFYADAKEMAQEEFPHCARVIIRLHQPNGHGFPTREESEVLWAMEDHLTQALQAGAVRCVLVGLLTHASTRELVFQLADWAEFLPPTRQWMGEHPDYKLEVSEHEGWEFFQQWVWPAAKDWLRISDRRVIDSLVRSGSDPKKPHSLEFVFRGAPAELAQMRDSLLPRSYTVLDFAPLERRLIMARPMTLDLRAINEESLSHDGDAQRLGLEYSGWGCRPVP